MMTKYLIAYAATAFVLFALDFLWLGTLAGPFYREKLANILSERPNIPASVAFYAFYCIGVVIFAEMRGFENQSALYALGFGALFGFFAYATYDITNYATLKDFPLVIAVLDISWGTALTGVSAFAGYYAATFFKG